MTYKELLQKVTFKEMEPYLVEHYKVNNALGWYKLHYDMLILLEPKVSKDANGNVCKIGYYSDYEGDKHIEAWPMEGDLWEHCLTKEIVVDDCVTEPLPELAACCLWHFTDSHHRLTNGVSMICFASHLTLRITKRNSTSMLISLPSMVVKSPH